MKIGQIVPISEQIKSKYKDLQQYSFRQYLGSNFDLTLLMSILDFLLASKNDDQIQRLGQPNRMYSKSSQIIADKIQNYILKERKLQLFYEQIQIGDIQYVKVKEFLQQFCNVCQKPINFNFQEILKTFGEIFQLSFQILGEQEIKIPNKKQQCIFLYQEKHQYYYIQQYDENRNQKNEQYNCSSYNKMDQIQLKNSPQKSEKDFQEFKIQLSENQFEKQDNIQTNDRDRYSSQQIIKKPNEKIYMEQEKLQDNQEQKLLICMKCKDKSQTQIFTNKSCNHHFCLRCLNQFIIDLEVNYSCLEKNCEQIIDSQSYYYFSQNLSNKNDDQVEKNAVKAEYKICNGCSKSVLRNLQFTNLCLHHFCRDCSIKFAKNTQIFITCPFYQCNKKISSEQLMEYLKSEQILFQCSKCQKQLERQNLFLNSSCPHFLCFDCSYEMVIKNNTNQFHQSCPIDYCQTILDPYLFDKFFESNQNIVFEEQQKKEQLQNQILTQNQESQSDKQFSTLQENFKQPLSSNNNNNNKFLIQTNENDQEQNNDQFYDECTFCYTNFSDYNLRQKLDCKFHQIGVCCSLENENCPQCIKKNYYTSKDYLQSKLKFTIVNQDFDFYNVHTTIYQE